MKFTGKWIGGPSGENGMFHFKQQADGYSKTLKDFKKNHGLFAAVIGSDLGSRETAEMVFNYLKDSPNLLQNIDNFMINEEIGNPVIHNIQGVSVTRGALMHLRCLHNIINYLGLENVSSIVEIGSGYGGQCKIIKSWHDVPYTCIDLKETLNLCRAYTQACDVKDVEYFDTDETPKLSTNLVISNYCISELDEQGIDFYFDNIIDDSDMFYFEVGNYKQDMDSHKHLIKRCRNKFDTNIHEEAPKCGSHRNVFITGKKQ